VSLRRLGSHFFAELSKSNSTVFVLINLINELVNFFLGDEESARLDHSSEFILGDRTVVVEVKRVESLIDIEARVALHSLSNTFTGILSAEMNSAQITEVSAGSRVETVISLIERTSMVISSSVVDHGSVIGVKGKECFAQFIKSKSSVAILVVSGNEEFQFIVGRVNTHGVETITKLIRRDPSVVVMIKDSESIVQVEVRFHGKSGFGSLEFSFNIDNFFKSTNKLVFILQMKNRLS